MSTAQLFYDLISLFDRSLVLWLNLLKL